MFVCTHQSAKRPKNKSITNISSVLTVLMFYGFGLCEDYREENCCVLLVNENEIL